jgi:ketosteroid isomerase-like protein
MDMWYRTTTFYKNIDGKWLITHEHVSDPIDMETGKVIFDLQP